MAEKTLNTRFQLPYDTYTNWSVKNPKLKKGEMVQVEVPAPKDAIVQAPSVLIKVGDGIHNFNDLAWTSGLAADIYDWAKAATKPSYNTSELTNDSGFVSSTETVEANLVNNLTISYSATLTPANWTANGSNFVYNYSNTSLRAFVCPIITCTSNTNEYGYINDAEATSGSGIIFTATKKPTANIELIIIDMG